jgi:hypothetical protein
VTAEPRLSFGHELAAKLLEELIYERVRAHVDLLELGLFEADLDLSIRRVLAELDRATVPSAADPEDEPPSAILATALIDRAWARVVSEWESRQSDDDDDLDDDCPICKQMELDEELGELAARSMRRPRARKEAAT